MKTPNRIRSTTIYSLLLISLSCAKQGGPLTVCEVLSDLSDRRQLHFPINDNYTSLRPELIINIISFLFLANAGYFFAPAFADLWETGSEVP
jgi:hypothetical protein